MMHHILERQIKRFFGASEFDKISEEWKDFLQAVSDTYSHSDEDRTLVLRSLELSSVEFAKLNKKLHSENEIVEQKVRDRTEALTKANEELRTLDKRKSEFLSVVAHQLRTPLTGIKWALSMLLQSQSEAPSTWQKKLLVSCDEGNERMITIVNEMLRADRTGTGTFEVTLVATDMTTLITSVVKELHLLATERAVTITFTNDADIPTLMVDPEMMRFAFQNLLDNAVKYSPPHGTVEIRTDVKNAKMTCSITDHGIGIPTNQQSYIFSRFFRAQNAISTEPNGNGLGLSIVKSIIEKHGGTIEFTSEENKGTTFIVSLPYNITSS